MDDVVPPINNIVYEDNIPLTINNNVEYSVPKDVLYNDEGVLEFNSVEDALSNSENLQECTV